MYVYLSSSHKFRYTSEIGLLALSGCLSCRIFRLKLYFGSLKRRTETCVDGEAKGEAGHKWGPSRLLSGLRSNSDFCAYLDSGALEFGFFTLWLVNPPEIGDTMCGFFFSACCLQTFQHVGVMVDAVKMTWEGLRTESHNLGGLKPPNFAVRCPII
jgi:hypothetical protein